LVLTPNNISSKGVSLNDKANKLLVGSTLNSDPPVHDITRSITAAPLLPGALEAVRERVENAAERLIELLVERRSIDAVPDLAQYLPVTIVSELVGLPDAGRAKMLEWAAATFDLFASANERTDAAFSVLVDLRKFLDEYGRPEKLKPGGWAARIFEVGRERGMPGETCAQLMRDYINPSLDTTISATGFAIWLFAQNPQQWDRIRRDPTLIDNAIEEVIRFASPIRAFSRYVAIEQHVAGVTLPEGARVMMVYASANRDERKWSEPDRFDIGRKVKDHVGFGSGVHMCMGMHLARLEIKSLLASLARKVERFELSGPTQFALNNTIRAFSTLPVILHAAKTSGRADVVAPVSQPDAWIEAVVTARRQEADGIISLTLHDLNGSPLPAFDAGAHVDLRVKEGLVRQYSISSDPADQTHYRLGIFQTPDSRGGSRTIHDQLFAGHVIKISRPRNNFPLRSNAGKSILIAGGIGITPLLSMATHLDRKGATFEVHYCTRSASRTAFKSELAQFGSRTRIYHDDDPEVGRFELESVLKTPSPDTHIYICGPKGFMEFVTSGATRLGWRSEQVHVEHFGAEIDTDGDPFTVVAARSGRSVEVHPGQTIAEALMTIDVPFDTSCRSGVCGTCLTRVIEGTPDHRDFVQTEIEKAANDKIAICCSRSRTRQLILDI
jgi:ferredoxin-NADP reductase/cytochrome P450